jgi:hypothetical protein
MRWFFLFLISSVAVWAQDSSNLPSAPSPQPGSSSTKSQAPESGPTSNTKPAQPHTPDLSPPRSDRISADSIEEGSSSSKDTQVDLTAPPDDTKAHPQGAEAVNDAEAGEAARGRGGDVGEFHPWNPHKAAKDVEVGDFYFKRKNYTGAEDRYREALYFKNNDATATFRLAVCLEKLNRPDEARQEYESYLKILPHGPEAQAAHKAIDRLKISAVSTKPAN